MNFLDYYQLGTVQISIDGGNTWNKAVVSIRHKKNTNLIKRLAARGIIRAALKPN